MVIRRSLLTMLCSGGLALAQFTVTASHSEDQVTFTFGPDKVAADNAITGRPYSATLTSERTARDGTRMIQPARHVYRDSQGRTRTEEQHPTIYGAASFLAVEINDPVAGFAYVVDTENHVAHRLAIKVGSKPAARGKVTCASTPPTGSSNLPSGIVAVTERLGEQTIEGAIFCGSKHTTTYPAGSVFHNDRPVKAVDETWNAWEDGLPFFLVKNSMPGGETSTTWIRDVSLLEPDSTLFRPPAEYAVVEETGTFSIQLSRAIPAATSVHQVTALTDMPFSAEEAYEIQRTDPNGALLTQRFSFFHYRDSMGRTVFGSMIADSSGTQTFRPSLLMDVVAGYSYSFNYDAATVRRRPLRANFKPASQAVPPKPASPDGRLGTQTIDGFQTFGRRMTQKYAPGTMGGNDRPFVVVEELWTSPQLGIALLTKRSHPEMGDTTATVRNVTVGEPDAALFRVPDGYRIIDESEKAHE